MVVDENLKSNIFTYTHELSHSAFWAWCIASLKTKRGNKDNKLIRILAKRFLKRIKVRYGSIKEVETEVANGEGDRYDICIITELNGKNTLTVVETKLGSQVGGALKKYHDNLKNLKKCEKWVGKRFPEKAYRINATNIVLLDIEGSNEEVYAGSRYKNYITLINSSDLMLIFKDIKRSNGVTELYKNWLKNNDNCWNGRCKRILDKVISSNIGRKLPIENKTMMHTGWGYVIYTQKKIKKQTRNVDEYTLI